MCALLRYSWCSYHQANWRHNKSCDGHRNTRGEERISCTMQTHVVRKGSLAQCSCPTCLACIAFTHSHFAHAGKCPFSCRYLVLSLCIAFIPVAVASIYDLCFISDTEDDSQHAGVQPVRQTVVTNTNIQCPLRISRFIQHGLCPIKASRRECTFRVSVLDLPADMRLFVSSVRPSTVCSHEQAKLERVTRAID